MAQVLGANVLQQHEGILTDLTQDENTLTMLNGDVLGRIPAAARRACLKDTLFASFIKPKGVHNAPWQAAGDRITNREFQGLCVQVQASLQANHPDFMNQMQQTSPLFLQYGSFWPNCAAQLDQAFQNIIAQQEQQNRLRTVLGQPIVPV